MTSFCIGQRHHVEQKWFHIVVKCFVIEEEFGQQTEMLTVLFVSFTIDLPYAELLFAVNLQSKKTSYLIIMYKVCKALDRSPVLHLNEICQINLFKAFLFIHIISYVWQETPVANLGVNQIYEEFRTKVLLLL